MLQDSIDAIKGQVEEEIHNRTVLKSRINTEAADLKAAREQFKKKQEAVRARFSSLACRPRFVRVWSNERLLRVFPLLPCVQSKKLLAEVQRAIQSSEQKAIKWRAIHADKAAILAKALEDLRAATAAFEAMRADLQGGIDVARPQIESHKACLCCLSLSSLWLHV